MYVGSLHHVTFLFIFVGVSRMVAVAAVDVAQMDIESVSLGLQWLRFNPRPLDIRDTAISQVRHEQSTGSLVICPVLNLSVGTVAS